MLASTKAYKISTERENGKRKIFGLFWDFHVINPYGQLLMLSFMSAFID